MQEFKFKHKDSVCIFLIFSAFVHTDAFGSESTESFMKLSLES